jgi:hypothetical protein
MNMTDVPKPDPTPGDKPPAGDPWYKGKVDDVTVGYLQSRGLHDKPLEEVALASIKAHQEATKLLSAPQTELVRVPSKPDDPAWADVWKRLGAPADAKEYDFSAVKRADGSGLDEPTVNFLRTQAAALHLSKQGALDLAQNFVKDTDGKGAAARAESEAKLQEQVNALKSNWGSAYEANKFIATQGAQKLGLTAAEVAQLEKLVGYDRIMEAMRKVGTLTGDDTSVKGNTNNGVMTREEAMNKKAELMTDAAWKSRYIGGGKAELREMVALNTIILGS